MRGGGLKRVSSRVRGARHELDGPPHQHLVLSKQKTEGGQRKGTSEEVRGAKEGSGLESGVAHLRYLVPCSANSGAQHAARPKSRAAAAHLELLNHSITLIPSCNTAPPARNDGSRGGRASHSRGPRP